MASKWFNFSGSQHDTLCYDLASVLLS